MNRRQLLGAAMSVGAITTVLSYCGWLGPSYRFNYRLRMTVMVAGRKVEGSSVIEVAVYERGDWRLPEVPRFAASSWGEAVVIELGPDTLFGLLVPPEFMEGFNGLQPQRVLGQYTRPEERLPPGYELPLIPKLEGEFELQRADTPVLIRFRDLNDPRSAELVDMTRIQSIFGEGARLERATISVTTDRPTKGILEGKLPWLNAHRGELSGGADLDKALTDRSLAARLTPLNFKLEGTGS